MYTLILPSSRIYIRKFLFNTSFTINNDNNNNSARHFANEFEMSLKQSKLYAYASENHFPCSTRNKELIDPSKMCTIWRGRKFPLAHKQVCMHSSKACADRKTGQSNERQQVRALTFGVDQELCPTSMIMLQLDAYYPEQITKNPDEPNEIGKPPILAFLYGGRLVQGARSTSPSNFVHNNLGAFFASRGILTIIADYCLAPGITFPERSEDVHDAF